MLLRLLWLYTQMADVFGKFINQRHRQICGNLLRDKETISIDLKSTGNRFEINAIKFLFGDVYNTDIGFTGNRFKVSKLGFLCLL